MRVLAASWDDFEWLVRHTGLFLSGGFKAIKAVDDAGRIHGMVGYDDWTRNSVRMHVALETAAGARALLRPAFAYPFEEVGLDVAIGLIRQGNKRACRNAARLGFTLTHVIREGWSHDEHLFLYEMRKGECRWLSDERFKP